MTVRLLVQCDGTPADRPGMALERCRAFYPTRVDVFAREHRRDTFREAGDHGWTVDRDDARDLCPACTRALAAAATDRCAHTSTMRQGDRRVCTDCGVQR